MKHILTFITAILLSTASNAQHKYIPIPEDSAVWVTTEEKWHEGQSGVKHTFIYSIGRTEGIDTIINGKRYIAYFGEYPNYSLPLPTPKSYAAYYGTWIRNDSVSRKVWFIRDKGNPGKEELLYDFSLKKGDTINEINSSYLSPKALLPYKAWVEEIDSIYWPDNTWRYRWWIKTNWGYSTKPTLVTMVEGMGFTTNLLNNPLLEFQPLIYSTYSVSCFKVRDKWLFTQTN